MNVSFREAATFERVREKLFGGDENYRHFQSALMQNPRAGDVIPGTGGIRKVRFADEGRGKGKRGGLRIIYLYVEEFATILLIAAYDKNIPDITAQQKKMFAQYAQAFHDELKEESTRRR